MRRELQKISNQKKKFRGTFERFGSKANWKTGVKEPTVLLKDVKDNTGKLVADHLWFNYTKKLEKLDLKEGDRIQFHGIVKSYLKGYEKDIIDYKISYPSQVVKISQDSVW